KGVALSHRAVLNQLAAYADSLVMAEGDVIVSWLPLYHDMGLIAGFLLPLVQGIPLVLMSPFDWVAHPALLLQALHDYRGTLCWLPNFAYNHMARRIRKNDLQNLSLGHVRAFINCSEPVQAKSHALFAERFSEHGIRPNQLAVSYAMAENTFAVTQTAIGDVPTVDSIDANILQSQQQAVATTDGMLYVSCGKPIAHTQFRVLDSDGNELAERMVGELVIKSDCMLTGYHNRRDLQAFTDDGWYFTGDMGYVSNGEVYIVGRKKDLIINAGKNVYPQDIEAIVNTITGVHAGRCVVFGVPDERDGTELVAVLIEKIVNSPSNDKDIKRAIRRTIAKQTTVSAQYVDIVPSGWLIKTSSGKIARDANRDKWLQSR
ncbi:MAG: AMP-binding protein, partial [Chloroflexota bacterium]